MCPQKCVLVYQGLKSSLQTIRRHREAAVILLLRAYCYATHYLSQIKGGERSFKNSGFRKILVKFHGSRNLIFGY